MPVQLRDHRGGLGIEGKRKRQQAEMAAMRARMAAKRANITNDYKSRLAEERSEKEVERDLRSSKSVCFQLDSEQVRHLWTVVINFSNINFAFLYM